MPVSKPKLAAIVVAFHPDVTSLVRLVAILSLQVEKVFIIDNTPRLTSLSTDMFNRKKTTLIHHGVNLGVAGAHNVGINRARRDGFTHVVLMDQDSVPDADMIPVLYKYLSLLSLEGMKVGAVGPKIIDAWDGKARGFVSTRRGRYSRISSSPCSWIACDFLTSSGTLIPMEVLEDVGGMEEELFIDCVDIEWGYRAASRGFCCVGVFDTQMRHRKGEKSVSLFGLRQVLYSPVRHYYFFRNICELARKRYVNAAWKRNTILTSSFYAIFLTTIVAPRLQNFKMIMRGIMHGLRRQLGPIS